MVETTRDEELVERMKLVYLIEGLQDELDAACNSIAEYRQRDKFLKRQLAKARITLRRESMKWIVHGIGVGFMLGYVVGWASGSG